MAVKPVHREMLKAFAVGNTDKAREINEQVSDSEREDYHTLVSALFTILLEYQFKDHLNRESIAGFVNQMRTDYRNAKPPIKPLTIEGVIRAAFGEDYFLEEISPEDTLSAQYQVIGKITAQHDEVSSDIDGYLDKVEALVAEWEADE